MVETAGFDLQYPSQRTNYCSNWGFYFLKSEEFILFHSILFFKFIETWRVYTLPFNLFLKFIETRRVYTLPFNFLSQIHWNAERLYSSIQFYISNSLKREEFILVHSISQLSLKSEEFILFHSNWSKILHSSGSPHQNNRIFSLNSKKNIH